MTFESTTMSKNKKNILGRTYLYNFHFCDSKLINNLEYIREKMLEAATLSKATIINDLFHQFSPQGVSGVIVIAESHLSIHTWPELGCATVDLFTCSEKMNANIVYDHLKEAFRAQAAKQEMVIRPTPNAAILFKNKELANCKEIYN